MRAFVWGSAILVGALSWGACLGDEPDPVVARPDGGSSSGSTSSSSGSEPGPDSGPSSSSSGGSSSSSSSGEPGDAGDGGIDCERNLATGLCTPVTLRANLVNPYGVTVASVAGGTRTLAVWVRGAPEAAGAVERCDVGQCDDSVVKVADTMGANGIDSFGDPHPISGRTIVTDGASVRWVSFSSRSNNTYPRPRDLVGGCSLLDGCTNPARETYAAPGPHAASQLANAGGTLLVRDSLGYVLGCDMATCDTFGQLVGGDTYRRGLATDGNTIAWTELYNPTLGFCRRDGALCADGSTRSSGNIAGYGDASHTVLDLVGDKLLGVTPTTAWACTATSCSATLHTLATNQTKLTAAVSDGVNAYWAAAGNGTGAGDTGFIETCPVDGCGGVPPKRVASGLVDPRSLFLHAGVLYWVNFGNAASPGSLQAVRL